MSDKGPLGQKVDAPDVYAPSVLFPVPRALGRGLLGLADQAAELPFAGEDTWNCYELSWLSAAGVPRRAVLELRVACTTPNISESKSLKLYLNSLSFTRFAGPAELLATITADVWRVLGGTAAPTASLLAAEPPLFDPLAWECIDEAITGELPAEVLDAPDESRLRRVQDGVQDGGSAAGSAAVTERLVSHLLRTLCPVTGQPDWGSLFIEYRGAPIDRSSILEFVCTLRREVGFHENAVERVFLALQKRCEPEALRVTGRFLRRGGIDINPMRYTAGADASLGPPPPQLRVPGQ